MGQWEKLVGDALLARSGDTNATLRVARAGIPMLAKRMLPGAAGPLVDIAAGLYDSIARPELQVARPGSYTTPGAGDFAKWLKAQESGLFLTVGAPGSGKTALNCQIADRWRASVKYMAGVPRSALHGTPLRPFDLTAANVARLPEGSVLIIPDAAFEGLDSRDHGGSLETMVRKLATVTRHRSVRILADSQGTSLMSKSLFNTPSAIFVRPLGVTWQIAERDGFTRFARVAMAGWAEIPPDERFNYVFAISDAAGFMGFVRAGIPDWYTDNISRAHALTDDEDLGIIDGTFTEAPPHFEDDVAQLLADGLTRIQAEAVILSRERAKGRKS